MSVRIEELKIEQAARVRDLCNELMAYQKAKASIHPEFFDGMRFETRLLPSLASAKENYLLSAEKDGELVGYAYSTIAPKRTYSGGFATLQCDAFFDFDSVAGEDVGCLSQFYIKQSCRGSGIGSELFNRSMDFLRSFPDVSDLFIFVSNGNESARKFYLDRGFRRSHEILDGFITVLRNS